jgi:hypothetical protein|nr:MAG TPA: hypothetical protein [Caudoviricetes sp.]
MDLKLNIYEKKKIVKTYTAETYDLMFGTVEDLIDLIDLDQLKNGTDAEIIKLVGKVIINGMGIIKPLLKDIFEGLTDEELKKTKVSEISTALVEIVKFSISQITKGTNGKN